VRELLPADLVDAIPEVHRPADADADADADGADGGTGGAAGAPAVGVS
jgi:hypothetical protein